MQARREVVENGVVDLEIVLEVEMREKRNASKESGETLRVRGEVEMSEFEVSEGGKGVREMAKGEFGDVGKAGEVQSPKSVATFLRRCWIS